MIGSAQVPVIEVLYPEYANQAGDNGNVMYLRACLPQATFIETSFSSVPYFVEHTPDLILLCNMTEAQQAEVIERLRPYRSRLLELIDLGTNMLFTGNAPEVLCREIRDKDNGTVPGLDIVDLTVERDTNKRYLCVQVGSFTPASGEQALDLVGYRIQFTQAYGDNEDRFFQRCRAGWGINEQSLFEGFRINNLLATWMIGPVLPLNPPFTSWLLSKLGVDTALACEEQARKAYEIRLRDHLRPGMHLAY